MFKSGETVVGKKKAVEKIDLEVMRILVQHLSARRITDGTVQNEGRIVWMDETDAEVGNLFCHKTYLGQQPAVIIYSCWNVRFNMWKTLPHMSLIKSEEENQQPENDQRRRNQHT